MKTLRSILLAGAIVAGLFEFAHAEADLPRRGGTSVQQSEWAHIVLTYLFECGPVPFDASAKAGEILKRDTSGILKGNDYIKWAKTHGLRYRPHWCDAISSTVSRIVEWDFDIPQHQ
jgi:hypothetical protein